jgi:hypothetical protein
MQDEIHFLDRIRQVFRPQQIGILASPITFSAMP